MKTLTAQQVIRHLAGKDCTIYNDKLKNGTRSFKVWGWSERDYFNAVAWLEHYGHSHACVKTHLVHRSWRYDDVPRTQARIWVRC